MLVAAVLTAAILEVTLVLLLALSGAGIATKEAVVRHQIVVDHHEETIEAAEVLIELAGLHRRLLKVQIHGLSKDRHRLLPTAEELQDELALMRDHRTDQPDEAVLLLLKVANLGLNQEQILLGQSLDQQDQEAIDMLSQVREKRLEKIELEKRKAEVFETDFLANRSSSKLSNLNLEKPSHELGFLFCSISHVFCFAP